MAIVGIWSIVEVDTCLFCGSIIAIKPLVRKITPKILSLTRVSSSNSSRGFINKSSGNSKSEEKGSKDQDIEFQNHELNLYDFKRSQGTLSSPQESQILHTLGHTCVTDTCSNQKLKSQQACIEGDWRFWSVFGSILDGISDSDCLPVAWILAGLAWPGLVLDYHALFGPIHAQTHYLARFWMSCQRRIEHWFSETLSKTSCYSNSAYELPMVSTKRGTCVSKLYLENVMLVLILSC